MSHDNAPYTLRADDGEVFLLSTLPRLTATRTTTANSFKFSPILDKDVVQAKQVEPPTRGTTTPFLVSFAPNDTKDPRAFSEGKKWFILILALLLQAWVNAISVMASSAIEDIAEEMHVTMTVARVIQAGFLYGTALGAIVWTPLSEDYGRLPTHLVAVTLMAIFQIPCALATNYSTLLSFRILAGFSSAVTFNSVGMINDMWDTNQQSWPINVFALASEVGNEVGAVIGGYLVVSVGWRWMFGINGIVTAILLVIFAVFTPETRSGVILHQRAAHLRKSRKDVRYYALHEIAVRNRTARQLLHESLFRPVYMLFCEPIVLWFALFDGFNYAITYLALESLPLVYAQWGFHRGAQNLPFLALLVGNLIAFALYYFQLLLEAKNARKNNGVLVPEARLLWMLLGGLLFPISLFWFAWTSQGPPLHWIVSIFGLGLFGVSSHIIYISVSDYTVASYSIYSASAFGAQSLFREFLSGSVTLFATPLYKNLNYQWASTLLAFIATAMAVIPFLLYFYGPKIRAKSAFYLRIKAAEEEGKQDREEEMRGVQHALMIQRGSEHPDSDIEGRRAFNLQQEDLLSVTQPRSSTDKVHQNTSTPLVLLQEEGMSRTSFYSCY